MDGQNNKKSKWEYHGTTVRTVVIYAVFGILWIYFSDTILEIFIKNQDMYQRIQTVKGILYILITAALLYRLIYVDYSKIYRLNLDLKNQEEETLATLEETVALEEELRDRVDKLNSMTDQLQNQYDFIEAMYDSSNAAIMVWDLEGTAVKINDYFTELLGYTEEDCIGKKWLDIMIPEDIVVSIVEVVEELKAKRKIIGFENRILHKDGHELILRWNDSIVMDPNTQKEVVVAFGIDVTQERTNAEKILEMAYTDGLTGLKNKLKLEMDLEEKIKVGKPFNVIHFDIENFKQLNDIHGHDYGDILLKKIATRIEVVLHEGDHYRWSGDEFIIVLDDNHMDDIEDHVEDLFNIFKKSWSLSELNIIMNICAGISQFPKDGTRVLDLIKNTEMALYQAKEKGDYVFYKSDFKEAIEMRALIENQLQKDLEADKLFFHLQPIYNLADRSVHGLEALIRWKPDEIEFVSTYEFIATAERTGLILQVDQWVLRKMFELIKTDGECFRHKIVSINISSQTFNSKDFITYLDDLVDEYEVDPKFIVLEITEHTILGNVDYAYDVMTALRKRGFQIALDDFGTKYSSLNYLSKLPLNKLKIDKSYIDYITTGRKEKIIVSQLVEMTNKLGLTTVAEGIEDLAQEELLNEFGCNFGQGYYFAKPMSVDDFKKFLKDRNGC